MNYEEKLKEAKRLYESANDDQKYVIESLFPELNESEDERIKKELIGFLQLHHPQFVGKRNQEKWIAWLEKQGGNPQFWRPTKEQYEALTYAFYYIPDNKRGNYYAGVLKDLIEDLDRLEKQDEQKPADKAEPKFKVGDWILYSGDHYEGVRYITKINENGYYIERNGSPHGIIPFNHEICMRLWSIQDAKDGDILYSPCCKLLWIYKDEKTCYVGSNLNYNSGSIVIDKPVCIPTDVQPATNAQRVLLFQKMKEAGYEWDAEKKELKMIDWSKHVKYEPNSPSIIEENTEWSEEDEHRAKDIIYFLDTAKKHYASTVELDACIDWLKSLKQRIGG